MRQVLLTLAAAALVAAAGTPAAPHERDYVVVLEAGVDVDAVVADHAELGAEVTHVYRHALLGYAAALSPEELGRVRGDRRVAYVEPDREVELAEQSTPTGVSRIGGPILPPGPAVRTHIGVAVIDTGIDLDHPDLGTVVPGFNCTERARLPDDGHGHGTHVAGTIAADDNGLGVVGVAPGVTLYAVKVFTDSGRGTYSAILCAIDWVTAHAAVVDVANMSLGWNGRSAPSQADCSNAYRDSAHTAICRATKLGVTFVVAAGNGAKDASGFLPAAYEEVIAVSALADSDGAPGGIGPRPSCWPTQTDDTFASFSNYGEPVDIAAPGVCILSTTKEGGYAVTSGTSMAAPHGTAAAALYIEAHPLETPAEVRAGLIAAQEAGPIPGDPDPFKEGVVHVARSGGLAM